MFIASSCFSWFGGRRSVAALLGLLALFLLPAFGGVSAAYGQSLSLPTFTKAFVPGTIGPGSTATLQFEITNPNTTGLRNLAFTDVLPAGMTIATPANASSTCFSGTLSAPNGGGTISYSGGDIGPSSTCSVFVDVTSSSVGTHTNTSGDLTSDAGNSGPATADLIVDAGLPGFTKSFAPSSIFFGGRSTLTLVIDNTANTSAVNELDFTDNLPTGMKIAGPANASTTCGTATIPATLTATAGGSVITLDADGTGGFPAVAAGASCTVTVDVVGTGIGLLGNTTENLLASFVEVGKASATLNVTVASLAFTKDFTDDPATPGGTVNLAFTITNLSRDTTATNISFTDDLDAVVSGLVATGLPASACGGTLSGTSALSFSGGSLVAPESSCTINVTLQVPAGASGTFLNTTGAITANVGGNPVTGDTAEDELFVVAAPALTKEFTNDPVTPGDDVTLRFTIENTSDTATLTDLAFTDELTTFLPFPVAATLPAPGFCNGSSSISLTSCGTDCHQLSVTGGELAPSASCTFDVTLAVPLDVPSKTYLNVTSAITGLLGGVGVQGDAATDNLVVVAAPDLSKEFIDDPVTPGGIATLEFTISYSDEASGEATNVAFTDSLSMLSPAMPGLVATGLPTSACGGDVTTPDGGVTIAFSGGSLMPGEDCSFSVALAVPASAAVGTYTNKTGKITATVEGLAVAGDPAIDDLLVAPLRLTKAFTDDPVAPGETVTLVFTLTNSGDGLDEDSATNITFTDNLTDVLSGLVSTSGTQNDVCGMGSQISGTSQLVFTGGMVAAGASCSFSVTLTVPLGTEADSYLNRTSAVTATINDETVTLIPATDRLVVEDPDASIVISKAFTNNPVAPGGTANLAFTIGYSGPSDATGITFTDDLAAALSGLAATTLPADGFCGTGSTLTGTSVLTMAGGTLAPGGSCTFTVTLLVPLGTPNGSYTNTTSVVTAEVDSEPLSGNSAIADLEVVGVPSNAPIANAGPDQTVECAAPGGTSVTLDGSASIDPNGGELTYTWTEGVDEEGNPIVIATGVTPTVTLSAGVHTITLTVENEGGIPDTDEVEITIEDGPPLITLNGLSALTLECAIDGYTELGATAVDACDGGFVAVTVGGDTVDPNTRGTYVVTYTATDAGGNTATATRTVTVDDTLPPEITTIDADILDEDRLGIWPPNHSYQTFLTTEIVASVSDVCDQTVSVAGVIIPSASSDEPEDDPSSGDGNTLNDIVISEPDCGSVDVRAERDGGGNGRVYTVDLDLADASGNIGSTIFEIQVPKNNKGTAIKDTPALYEVIASCTANIATVKVALMNMSQGREVHEGDKATDVTEEAKAVDEGTEKADEADVAADLEADAPVETAEIAAAEEVPTAYRLDANYPNPFNPVTQIRFGLPEAAPVRLIVYDILGRQVRLLVDGLREAGTHEVAFDGATLPSGAYLYRLETPAGAFVKTMLLMK